MCFSVCYKHDRLPLSMVVEKGHRCQTFRMAIIIFYFNKVVSNEQAHSWCKFSSRRFSTAVISVLLMGTVRTVIIFCCVAEFATKILYITRFYFDIIKVGLEFPDNELCRKFFRRLNCCLSIAVDLLEGSFYITYVELKYNK